MPNSFDAAYVSGGSSLGWASVVARGLVAFALGTDTATPADNALQALQPDGGAAIEVEVYEMPQAALGSFLALIPPPLGLGLVQLTDGRWAKGFICEGALSWGDVAEPQLLTRLTQRLLRGHIAQSKTAVRYFTLDKSCARPSPATLNWRTTPEAPGHD